ncbi:hypothetical protein Smp_143210 [Schistosoma mansoni]|uniref:Uncharacterized protein n=1 Tax=Schistosoma mansoni TaxID=6183 RepID=G4VI82_SCHMA|nr:hypothetical protein Smp_143210 [Schistosoma mansoni]|eukprot:XP_018651739.1 hypothetical protein Smp_143210 [Schistosoma mansoni]
MSKGMEEPVNDYVREYTEENDTLHNAQHRFRKDKTSPPVLFYSDESIYGGTNGVQQGESKQEIDGEQLNVAQPVETLCYEHKQTSNVLQGKIPSLFSTERSLRH